MDSLMLPPPPAGGRRRKRRHRSRVRQFYSDFNSDSSSSPSDSDSDHAIAASDGGGRSRGREGRSRGRRNRNTEARVFTFEQQQQHKDRSLPRAPRQNGHFHYVDDGRSPPRSLSAGPRPLSPWGAHSARRGPELGLPLSPGVTSNQDLKDRAYELIYQKKIKDLRSTDANHSCFAWLSEHYGALWRLLTHG